MNKNSRKEGGVSAVEYITLEDREVMTTTSKIKRGRGRGEFLLVRKSSRNIVQALLLLYAPTGGGYIIGKPDCPDPLEMYG